MSAKLRNNPGERDVVVLGGTVAVVLGLIYWALRAGFDNPTLPVISSVSLSLFLLVFPLVASAVKGKLLRGEGSPWYLTYPFLWLCGILISAGIGYSVPLVGINPFFAAMFFGVVGFGAVLALWVREKGLIRALSYIASAAAFGVWSGGVVWGRIYKNPLFVESLIADGTAHHDTLHLAALGNMLRTYHAASIGIDGLTYEPYHWGTAWLFVQWANLVGLDVLRFYQLTFPIVGIPLFFGGVALFAIFIRDRRIVAGVDGSRPGWRFWALLLTVSVGFLPIGGLDAMGVWTSNLLISESYTIAVPVALLLTATACSFAQNVKVDGVALADAPLRISDLLFLVVLVPLGIGALGYLKISLMVLSFAAAVFFFIRLSLYRRAAYLMSTAISAAVFLFAYPRVSLPAHREGFVPFDFLSSFVPPQWWPFFVFIHLFWTWAYVVVRLRRENIQTLGDLRATISGKRIIDVELVVGIAMLGIIPGLIVHIDGGSAFYFSDVQRWLAAGLLLPFVAGARTPAVGRKTGIGSWPTRSVLMAFLMVAIVGSALSNAIHWPMEMLRLNVKVRSVLYERAGHRVPLARARDFGRVRDPAILAAGLTASPNYPVVHELEQIRQLPVNERRHTALFIAQQQTPYWTMLSRAGACTFDSFVAPGLSGVALIEGAPPFGCPLNRYYGLGSYPARTHAETDMDRTESTLCLRAKKMGATTVLIVSFIDSAAVVAGAMTAAIEPRVSRVACRAPA
ncbi:MAG: hypothetical protein ABIQ55_10935 [Gemmatimonadaceae bacterium]